MKNKSEKILSAVPSERQDRARQILDGIRDKIPKLRDFVALKDATGLVDLQRETLNDVGDLEELMISEFPFEVRCRVEPIDSPISHRSIDSLVGTERVFKSPSASRKSSGRDETSEGGWCQVRHRWRSGAFFGTF